MKYFTMILIVLFATIAIAENKESKEKKSNLILNLKKPKKVEKLTLDKEKAVPKSQGVTAKKNPTLEAQSVANDAWVSPEGAFDMRNFAGRAMYYFRGTYHHTLWTYVDDSPVAGLQGWTYKENGFNFYMFFSKTMSNGKYKILYSTNNSNFEFFAFAK